MRARPQTDGSLSDSKIIGRLLSLLNRKEQAVIGFSLVVRLALVVLDIVGLSLVGVSVSLVSGTQIQGNSLTGKAISLIDSSGLGNAYAIFGFASVVFFLAKGLLSIQLNSRVLKAVAKIESSKSSSLFARISDSTLDKLNGLGKKELFIGLVDSFDMSVSKLIMSISVVFGEGALMIGLGIYLALVNPVLFAVVAVYFAILGFSMQKLVAKKTRDTAQAMQIASVTASEAIFSLYDNFRQLRSLGKGNVLLSRFSIARRKLADGTATMSNLSVMPRYITEIALMLGFALLILQRSVLGPAGISAATIAIFVAGSFRLIASLLPFQGAFALLKQISGSSRLALELTSRFPEKLDEQKMAPSLAPESSISISISKLTYKYPGAARNIINNVSIEIQPGDYLAVTGRSGSGKSTFADLLLGLREPAFGHILINGEKPSAFVARNPGAIAYVPQKCSLLEGTLRQNISLEVSSNDQDDSKIWRALDLAGMSDWARELPEGLDTSLGEAHRGLSGGQVQRIGLARAFCAEPKMLILDESTSALDVETELQVLDSLEKVRGKITIVAIAHRGNVIDHAATRVKLTTRGIEKVDVSDKRNA